MRFKKAAVIFIAIMMCIGITANAEDRTHKRPKGPLLIGEVVEVKKDGENTVLLVDGYLQNDDIIKEKVSVIVNKDTKVILSADKGSAKDDSKEQPKVEFAKGNKVFVHLDKAMTKSNPPQANAKFIKVSR